MADSTYEAEVNSILKLLSMQHPAPVAAIANGNGHDERAGGGVQADELVAARFLRKLKGKQVGAAMQAAWGDRRWVQGYGQHGETGGGSRDVGSTGDRRWVQGRGQHGGQEVGSGTWAARGTGGGFRDVGSTGDRRWVQGRGQHGGQEVGSEMWAARGTGGACRDAGSTGKTGGGSRGPLHYDLGWS